eukprot:COSAG01_NODE_2084_length_8459_cov_121.763038_6_plen_154_part_00
MHAAWCPECVCHRWGLCRGRPALADIRERHPRAARSIVLLLGHVCAPDDRPGRDRSSSPEPDPADPACHELPPCRHDRLQHLLGAPLRERGGRRARACGERRAVARGGGAAVVAAQRPPARVVRSGVRALDTPGPDDRVLPLQAGEGGGGKRR